MKVMNNDAAPRPRIFFRDRFWRVSEMPRPYWQNNRYWAPAHSFVARLNTALVDQRQEAIALQRRRFAESFHK